MANYCGWVCLLKTSASDLPFGWQPRIQAEFLRTLPLDLFKPVRSYPKRIVKRYSLPAWNTAARGWPLFSAVDALAVISGHKDWSLRPEPN